MEYEEQKPKDILLNDREIKQEMTDFLEDVKEESIEKNYFDQIVPKQETEELLLENVKKEPIGEEDYAELIIPKQETAELFRNVKQEPIDEEYFDQIIPKQDFSELMIPKREIEGSLESVKEEPRDEEDYSELLIPKHEEVIEPSASYMSNSPVQKSFIETQEDVPKFNVEPQKNALKRRCSVCSQICPRQNMKGVTMEEDKLVIMIGCVLRESYTLEQAQLFMTMRRAYYICYAHLSESINKIYDVLNIKTPDDLSSCSSEFMNTLMVTVNALIPQIEISKFFGIVYNFVRRNMSQKRNSFTHGEQSKTPRKQLCPVCTQNESSQNRKYVTKKEEKLVIMVGCILRGNFTHDQARSFISRKKSLYICCIHIHEVLNEIYKALDIKQSYEVSSCSTERMTNLMITVNELCSWITILKFRHMFNEFVMRNKKFLDRMMPSIQIESEEQKPKNIFVDEEIKQETEDFLNNVKEEITSCSSELMNNLMVTVNELCPQIENSHFCDILHSFVRRNISQKQKPEQGGRQQNYRCSVCKLLQSNKNMKHVTMKEEELVLMIGCILRGEYTLEQARSFMSRTKYSFICYVHFTQAINEIYKYLNNKQLSLSVFKRTPYKLEGCCE